MGYQLYPDQLAALRKEDAGKKWRPSNGEEGDIFMSGWCRYCANDLGTDEDGGLGCDISTSAFWHEIDEPAYPQEWQIGPDGQPQCTAYTPKTA